MPTNWRKGDILEIFGLTTLIAFTLVVVFMALLARGAYVYYYEPNKLVWLAEITLGLYGVLVGFKKIAEILS